jgi:hypothetical protein
MENQVQTLSIPNKILNSSKIKSLSNNLKEYLKDIIDEWIKTFDWTSYSWIVSCTDLAKVRQNFDSFEMLKLYLSTIIYQGEKEKRSTQCLQKLRLTLLRNLLFKGTEFKPFFKKYFQCPALKQGNGRGFFLYVMKDQKQWCGMSCEIIFQSRTKEEVCPIHRFKTIYEDGYRSRLWPRVLASFTALCIDLEKFGGSLQKLYERTLLKSKPENLTQKLVDYFKGITLPKGVDSEVGKIADLILIVMSHPFFRISVWNQIKYEELLPIDVNIEKILNARAPTTPLPQEALDLQPTGVMFTSTTIEFMELNHRWNRVLLVTGSLMKELEQQLTTVVAVAILELSLTGRYG